MTALVLGASAGLGRALAANLAQRGLPLLLIASDARDLDALAADLRLRYAVDVATLAVDLARCADLADQAQRALAALPPLRYLLLPAGYSRDDDVFALPEAASNELIAINFAAPTQLIQALLPQLLAAAGTVVGFGSVAAERGRGRNIVYAAAKRALQSLFESLRHRYASAGLRVQFYQLGFLRSNLSFGLALPLPAAEPEDIAADVVRRLDGRSGKFYRPRFWAPIAWLLRIMPWAVFARLKA